MWETYPHIIIDIPGTYRIIEDKEDPIIRARIKALCVILFIIGLWLVLTIGVSLETIIGAYLL